MEKSIVLKLKFFLIFLYTGFACFSPYLQVYFKGKNLTYIHMGIAFAGSSIIGVVIQPIWGYISDKYINKRKTMIVSMAASLVVILFIEANSFGVILCILFIYNIFTCQIGSVSDAYVYDVIDEKKNISYSNFRYLATAAYALTTLLMGFAIKSYGFDFTLIVFEVFSFAGLILLINMRYEGKQNLEVIRANDIKQTLKNKKLIIFFISIFFISSVINGAPNYMNELILFTKGDVSKLGMVWFVQCIFEVLTYFAASKMIKKFGCLNIYMISALIYTLKYLLDFFLKNANCIIAVQTFEGIAFTLYITSTLEYLMANTDSRIRATTMSINATVGGLGGFVLNLISGVLLNIITPSQLYGVFALVCLACFVCIMFLKADINKKLDSVILSHH